MTTSKKIAVVINAAWRTYASIDFDGYCRQLRAFGYSPTLVLHRGSEPTERDFPVVETTAAEMENAQFWRQLAAEAAIFFNWLRAPRILAAMKQAGLYVISRGDSDGQISARVFPGAAWLALENAGDGFLQYLQKRQWWLRRLVLCGTEDRDMLDTVQQSDAVATECDDSAKHLRRIFAFYKRPELGAKLRVIPHSVSDEILQHNLPGYHKRRALICGGRWQDAQKDPHLLTATLEKLLKKQEDLEVTIVGAGGDQLFEPLSRKFSQVNWRRRVARREIPQLLADSRIVLSSSRWEGYSIIALEGLCMGCTIVAPPLPGFVSMAENGRYGTISRNRTPKALANALEYELGLWDQGERSPAEISAVWRERTNNQTVVGNLVSLIP